MYFVLDRRNIHDTPVSTYFSHLSRTTHTRPVLHRHQNKSQKYFSSKIIILTSFIRKICFFYSDYLNKDVPNVLNQRERWYYWVKARLSQGITMVGQSRGRNTKEILVVLTLLQQTQCQTDSALAGLPRQPRTDSKLRIFYLITKREQSRAEQTGELWEHNAFSSF